MQSNAIHLTADVVAAYIGRNQIAMSEVPALLKSVHGALAALQKGEEPKETPEPAVPIKKSVSDAHIVCLEDGKKLTMLKRYLRTHYDMSPEAYRQKWGLPVDYPMVAPAYARLRSAFAKKNRLGHIPNGRGKRK